MSTPRASSTTEPKAADGGSGGEMPPGWDDADVDGGDLLLGNLHDGEHANVQLPGGVTYSGGVVSGMRSGAGVQTTAQDEYTGDFHRNRFHGRGTFRSTLPQGQPHPSGVTEYDGDWAIGVMHGHGRIKWATGDTYTGPFVQGKPHGDGGRFNFADGRVYDGSFVRGVRHGRGRLTQRNGEYYEGAFDRGQMTGEGRGVFGNGSREFFGTWLNGKKVRGKMVFANSKRVYEGEWHDEKPHGTGHMVFANGDTYDGDFVAGKLQGRGRMVYHSQGGKVYEGQFMNDQPHGRGTITTVGGHPVDGVFASGVQLAPTDTAAVAQVELDWAERGASAGPTPPRPSATPARPPASPSRGDVDGFDGGFADGRPARKPSPRPPTRPNAGSVDGKSTRRQTAEAAVAAPEAGRSRGGSGGDPHEEMRRQKDNINAAYFSERHAGSSDDRGSLESTLVDGYKGWLEKFSIGRSRLLSMQNWKRRFFVMAALGRTVSLGYYKDSQCVEPVGFIRLAPETTRIVTRPSLMTHKQADKPGRDICVIYADGEKEYKLLLRCEDTREYTIWVAAFKRLFTIVDDAVDFPVTTGA